MANWIEGLVGEWSGPVKTWLDPSKPPDEGSWRGTFRTVAGGRYLAFEYSGVLSAKPHQGFMLIVAPAEKATVAWVDTAHMASEPLNSEGVPTPNGFDVHGTWDAGGGSRWGWRTRLELHGPDRATISMFVIEPGGPEQRAAEVELKRSR